MSAYKKETWIKKGFTEEEALFQIAIRRPTNKLYWIHKHGLSEDEAEKKVKENQIKSSLQSAKRPKEEIRKTSVRCVEYWQAQGYSHTDAIKKVSEIQTTFTLKKCIEKYGKEEGLLVWENRQKKWQKTLTEKNQIEIDEINLKKNSKKLSCWVNKYGSELGKEKFILYLEKVTSSKIPLTLKEVEQYLLDKIDPIELYLPVNKVKKRIPNYIWELVSKPKDIEQWLRSFIDFKIPHGQIKFSRKTNNRSYYQMHVGEKLLRSSNEIYFYELLCELGLKNTEDFIIELPYNKHFRCDFYLTKGRVFVELLGFNDEVYLQKMYYKASTFGSILLDNKKQYKKFITEYYDKHYNNR